MANATHHHFVPQFYLRNFANGVGSKASFHGIDLEKRSLIGGRVRNFAGRRNFNRVNIEGVDPNIYENASSLWEGQAAPLLKEVIEAQSFPSDDHFSHVMTLIALLSVRHPRVRSSFSAGLVQMARVIADLTTANEERWNSTIKKMEAAGQPVNPRVTYKDAREFIVRGEYDIKVDQSYFVQLEPDLLDPVLETLSERTWSFKIAPEGAAFVTSDYPAVLRWVNDTGHRWSPGHRTTGTMLLFTLSPEVALIGTFGDAVPQLQLSAREVAVVNSVVLTHAYRQVFMRDTSSMFIGPAGVLDADGMVNELRRQPARGTTQFPS